MAAPRGDPPGLRCRAAVTATPPTPPPQCRVAGKDRSGRVPPLITLAWTLRASGPVLWHRCEVPVQGRALRRPPRLSRLCAGHRARRGSAPSCRLVEHSRGWPGSWSQRCAQLHTPGRGGPEGSLPQPTRRQRRLRPGWLQSGLWSVLQNPQEAPRPVSVLQELSSNLFFRNVGVIQACLFILPACHQHENQSLPL